MPDLSAISLRSSGYRIWEYVSSSYIFARDFARFNLNAHALTDSSRIFVKRFRATVHGISRTLLKSLLGGFSLVLRILLLFRFPSTLRSDPYGRAFRYFRSGTLLHARQIVLADWRRFSPCSVLSKSVKLESSLLLKRSPGTLSCSPASDRPRRWWISSRRSLTHVTGGTTRPFPAYQATQEVLGAWKK